MDEKTLLAIHAEVLAKYGEDTAQQVVMILLERLPDDPWHYARKIAPLEALKLKKPHRVGVRGKQKWVSREQSGSVPDKAIESVMDDLVHLNLDEPGRIEQYIKGRRCRKTREAIR
jgi:hypothetical protein